MLTTKDFPSKEWTWPIILTLGLVGLAARVVSSGQNPWIEHSTPVLATPVLALGWAGLLFFWFIHCFTGDAYAKRTMAVIFSFFFMLLAFGVVSIMVMSVTSATHFGVVEGCAENFDADSHTPIQCDYPTSTMGDSASTLLKRLAVAQDGKPFKVTPDADAAKAKVEAVSKVDPKLKKTRSNPEPVAAPSSAKPVSAADCKQGVPLQPTCSAVGIASAKVNSASPSASAASAAFEEQLMELYRRNANYHYLVNIGGHLTPYVALTPEKPGSGVVSAYAIRGGLTVPLYFILFALMGGAISLAKNIPGIQKRSDDSFVGTMQEPKLLPGATRELLLFQVLQFASAPILAIVAYHTIKPESMSTAVLLAFSAGFASDVILDQIRKLSNGAQKTSPDPANQVATTSIGGVVTRAGQPVVGAAVSVAGLSINAITNATGQYTLMAVPTSPLPVTLQVTATAGVPLTAIKAVSVVTPAAVKQNIEMNPAP